jgi:hypothetical protein
LLIWKRRNFTEINQNQRPGFIPGLFLYKKKTQNIFLIENFFLVLFKCLTKKHKTIMKTTTGLTIIHDGKRVNVYTKKEIENLESQSKFDKFLNRMLNLLNIKLWRGV